jgi:hypothetical protein
MALEADPSAITFTVGSTGTVQATKAAGPITTYQLDPGQSQISFDVQVRGNVKGGNVVFSAGCANIRLDCYGFNLTALKTQSACQLRPGEYIGNAKYSGMAYTENFHVYGLKDVVGGHGVNIEPPAQTKEKKSLSLFSFFDCYIQESEWESYYMGYTSGTAGRMEIDELRMGFCLGGKCKNDFLQPGSIKKMLIRNCFSNEAGAGGSTEHASSISMNENNGGAIYRSIFLDGLMPYTGTFGGAGRDIVLAGLKFITSKKGYWKTKAWHRLEGSGNSPMLAVVNCDFDSPEHTKYPMDLVCHGCNGGSMLIAWENNKSDGNLFNDDFKYTSGVKATVINKTQMMERLLKIFPDWKVDLIVNYDNEGYLID